MSVHQTREYFKKKDGYIVDNPSVGPTLATSYWECGNSKPFLQIVKDLTGKELSGDAWVNELKEDLEEHILQEKKEYDEMIEKCSKEEQKDDDLDLQMTVKFVDGDTIAKTSLQNSSKRWVACCRRFGFGIMDKLFAETRALSSSEKEEKDSKSGMSSI